MEKKKLTYQEVAEIMSGLVVEVNVISEKVSGILNRVMGVRYRTKKAWFAGVM